MISNTRKLIIEWIEQGCIDSDDSISQIKGFQASQQSWKNFLQIFSLWLGALSLVAGVIFFFAYNWDSLNRFYKFAIIESFLVGSVVLYFLMFDSKFKAVIQLVVSLSIGSLLALIGQTYQTGADPWQLFATWALLIVPLVIISQASSLWSFWLVLMNLSLALYFEAQYGFKADDFFIEGGAWLFLLSNGAVLLYLELTQKFKDKLSKRLLVPNRFAIRLSVFALLYILCTYGAMKLFSYSESGWEGYITYGVLAVAFWGVYRTKIKDFFILVLTSFSAVFMLFCLFIKILDNQLLDGGFIVLTLVIIASSTFTAIKLKQIRSEFSQGESSYE